MYKPHLKMKILRLFLGSVMAGLLVLSCASGPNSANVAIVEAYVNSVESLDYDGMANLLAEDYIGLGPSANDTIRKAAAVENWQYSVENIYEKIEYTRSQFAPVYIAEGPNKGDWVTHWSELVISYQSGETAKIWSNSTYKIEGGKIVKTFTFYNEADVLDQLGYVYVKP